MNDDYQPDAALSRHVATSRDDPRQAPTPDEYLGIKEALAMFVARGRSVTERTLQRYCEKHHLDGQKRITAEGEKWFVLKSSVERRLNELDEFDRLKLSRHVATSRDMSGPVGPENAGSREADRPRQVPTENLSAPVDRTQPSHTTSDDRSRQAATGRDMSRPHETMQPVEPAGVSTVERELYERLLGQYEDQIRELLKDKEALSGDKVALVKLLETKDQQIEHFFSSERDTKTLLGTLQNLMRAIWPQRSGGELGSRFVPESEALASGLDRRDGRDH